MNDVKPKKKKDSGVIDPSLHIIKTEQSGLSNWGHHQVPTDTSLIQMYVSKTELILLTGANKLN